MPESLLCIIESTVYFLLIWIVHIALDIHTFPKVAA
jgi:hypothetical protein